MIRLLLLSLTCWSVFLPVILENFNSFNSSVSIGHKDIKPNQFGEAPASVQTIVIDAGHGGRDPGCHGGHRHEKHIALNLALLLGQHIQRHYPNLRVLYTRKTDVFIPLNDRAELANRNKADLFISIHCNSIENAAHVKGSETYVLGLHRAADNLKVAKRENSSILYESDYQERYEGYDPESPEAHIMLSVFQNAYLDQSILFAELVEEHMVKLAHGKSRGVKQAGFLVLRKTAMPSVLIEAGYLSNAQDDAYLATKAGQEATANAIFQAFIQYKTMMDGLTNTADAPALPAPRYTTTDAFAQAATPQPKTQKLATERRIYPTPAPGKAEEFQAKGSSTKTIAPTSTPRDPDNTPARSRPVLLQPKKAPSPVRPNDIQFKIQLAVSAKLLNTKGGKWDQLRYSVEVREEQGVYKYLAIGFPNYQAAVNAKSLLRQQGFTEAFVVAYQKGDRLQVTKARKILGQ